MIRYIVLIILIVLLTLLIITTMAKLFHKETFRKPSNKRKRRIGKDEVIYSKDDIIVMKGEAKEKENDEK
ncbi:MAG: hypothetical protein N2517_06520 [Ignavibacteria bacterium]|nr:hypothetical protein [Ignavibacteria bacterium]